MGSVLLPVASWEGSLAWFCPWKHTRDLVLVGSGGLGLLEAGRDLIHTQRVVKGPGVKLGAQMFDRIGRCTPYTLHYLQVGDVDVYIKYSSSGGLGGSAPPFLEGYD